MSEASWMLHSDGEAMAGAVAGRIESIIGEAVSARGQALLVLPGGRSPVRTFERLCNGAIDWTRVTILPSDERLVAFDHSLSNAAMLARHFQALGARLLRLVSDAGIPYRLAGEKADAMLRALNWRPDLVWLGMGTDGHTASIFPGADLEAALDTNTDRLAVGVLPNPLPPEAPVARITLTRAAIRSAHHLLLAVAGPDKYGVIKRAMSDEHPDESPVGRVLRGARVDIHWSPA